MFIIKNPPLDPAEAGQDPAIAGQVLQGWEHMRVFPPLYEVERGIKGVSTFYQCSSVISPTFLNG
jgi:hypothetical protein